jgi:hypothetical protein
MIIESYKLLYFNSGTVVPFIDKLSQKWPKNRLPELRRLPWLDLASYFMSIAE